MWLVGLHAKGGHAWVWARGANENMALANCCLQIGSSGCSTNTNISFEELTSSSRTLDDEPSCEMFIFSSCCSMGDETSFVRFINEGTLSKKFASSSCFVIEETPFEKFTLGYSVWQSPRSALWFSLFKENLPVKEGIAFILELLDSLFA